MLIFTPRVKHNQKRVGLTLTLFSRRLVGVMSCFPRPVSTDVVSSENPVIHIILLLFGFLPVDGGVPLCSGHPTPGGGGLMFDRW